MAIVALAKQRRLEMLRRRLDKLQRKDQDIMAASQLAAEFGDGQEPPDTIRVSGSDGVIVERALTPREKQIAKDARKPKKEAPIYLEMAQRRFDNVMRIEQNRQAAVTLNVQTVSYVAGNVEATKKYPEIDISKDDNNGGK